MTNRRMIWALPVLNGALTALALWVLDDCDIVRVAREWALIGLAVGAYIWVVRSIPLDGPARPRSQAPDMSTQP